MKKTVKLFATAMCCWFLSAAAVWAELNIDFGTDQSDWAVDGECDDPRFRGDGMTVTQLITLDIMMDSTDCATLYTANSIALIGISTVAFDVDDVEVGEPLNQLVIEFGDDAGEWANDGECDDMRFTGKGMTSTILLTDDILHDASDCQAAYESALIGLSGIGFAPIIKPEVTSSD